jgi:hypothetical protein
MGGWEKRKKKHGKIKKRENKKDKERKWERKETAGKDERSTRHRKTYEIDKIWDGGHGFAFASSHKKTFIIFFLSRPIIITRRHRQDKNSRNLITWPRWSHALLSRIVIRQWRARSAREWCGPL